MAAAAGPIVRAIPSKRNILTIVAIRPIHALYGSGRVRVTTHIACCAGPIGGGRAVGKHVFALDSRMTKEVESLKEDLEHKFALQVAENKRLLNQLVKQKNEQGAMRKYIEALEERIRLLQDEVGI